MNWELIETCPRDHFPVLAWSIEYGRVVAFLDVTFTWWPCPASHPLPSVPTHWRPLPLSPNDPRLAALTEPGKEQVTWPPTTPPKYPTTK
jgi:hypothetical protein